MCNRDGVLIRRNQRGFTIVEVGVAAFVMAMAISSSIVAMQRAFVSIDTARNLTLAGQIMQSELEKIRLRDWATISSYSEEPTDISIEEEFTAAVGSRFKLQRVATTPESDMRMIKLTATWRSFEGREFSREYVTYYARYGIYDYFYNSSS